VKRLQSMPGMGPVTAAAVETFVPPMATYPCLGGSPQSLVEFRDLDIKAGNMIEVSLA
jgi:hypothetical protein